MLEKRKVKGNSYYWYIYETKCLINNKTYIGMRCPPSGLLPENDFYIGSGRILKRAIKKYGKNYFVKSILWGDIPSKKVADYLEQFTIWLWRKYGAAEYNIADGGQGGYLGDVVNSKRIKSLLGHGCSDETRKKISIAHTGTRRSPESIKKQIYNSKVKRITAFGITKTIKDWSQLAGLSDTLLRDRLLKEGAISEIAIAVGSKCILDFFVKDSRNVLHPLKNIKYNANWEIEQEKHDKIIRNIVKRKKQSNAWKKYRKNNYITAWGLTKIEKEWIAITGLNRGTLRARLKRGIPPEIALSHKSNCILKLLYLEYAGVNLCYTGR